MALTAAEVFRDYATDGVPASGVHEPKKSEIRAWGGNIDLMLNAGGLGNAVWKASRTLLTDDLAHAADTIAVVYDDSASANNGLYVKIGASGSGSWSQITTFLPGYQFVTATDDGGSTVNAYSMDTNPRLPFGDGVALVEFVVPATNTSATVTVSFDGDAPLTIKTASGNPPTIGGLIEGMPVSGVKIGSNFFMRSDQASGAIQAAAEAAAAIATAAAEEASNYADFAKDNWVLALSTVGTSTPTTDFPLSINPGSKNNMFVSVGGILQNTASYDLIDDGGPVLRLAEPLPEFSSLEVRTGSAATMDVPGDGTVGTPQLADKGTTLEKIQDVPTQRFLGRLTAGEGPLELLTAAQLQSLLAASGTIVDSKYARYTTRAAMSAIIPTDGSIPQITEGTQILSISITPKAVGNRFRIRFKGWGSTDAHPTNLVYAIFRDGQANAIDAGAAFVAAGGPQVSMSGEVEYTVSVVAPHVFSVRVGPSSTANAWLNGSAGNHQVSTAGGCTLVVEEIKG